jgi:hypothetical protein
MDGACARRSSYSRATFPSSMVSLGSTVSRNPPLESRSHPLISSVGSVGPHFLSPELCTRLYHAQFCR